MEINNVDDYLEHYGKKGMRWGVRSNVTTAGYSKAGIGRSYRNKSGKRVTKPTVNTQKVIDAQKAVAGGEKGFKVKYKASMGITVPQLLKAKGSIQKASKTRIDKGAEFQKKSNAGQAKIRTNLARVLGLQVSELNFN